MIGRNWPEGVVFVPVVLPHICGCCKKSPFMVWGSRGFRMVFYWWGWCWSIILQCNVMERYERWWISIWHPGGVIPILIWVMQPGYGMLKALEEPWWCKVWWYHWVLMEMVPDNVANPHVGSEVVVRKFFTQLGSGGLTHQRRRSMWRSSSREDMLYL